MKKIFLPLGLLALIAAPSAGSANMVIDMPPILAGKPPCKDDTGCTSGKKCCSGLCYSDVTSFCYNEKVCAKSKGFECGGTYYPIGVGYCCDGTYYNDTGFCCNNQRYTTGKCCNGVYYEDSCPVVSGPTGRLNDTGIIPPTIGSSGQEDADFGRDKTVLEPTPADGHAGFSFTKLDSSCVALTDQTKTYAQQPWSYVKDNVTGLIWEIQNDPLEKSWYNDNNSTNGGDAGAVNDGNNTQQYIQTANTSQWCGKTTWRLPTVKELFGLVNSSKKNMAVDQNYFPNINLTNGFFWSATPHADVATRARAVRFTTGQPVNYLKSSAYSVMLVRDAD